MSITSKKLVSAVLTASSLLWAVGVSALPVANAQSTADLQAQIAALLAQIQQLQAQLGSQGGSTTSVTFTRDLTVGSKGADVSSLQQILISKGFLAVSAPTGFFGALTKAAVAKWQASAGISPAAGYFGPKSRAFLSSTGTSTGSTGGNTGGNVPAPASGLRVGLASDNPAAGSLITGTGGGAARVPVMAVNFTAGNSGAVTVTEIKVHKTGVLSDNSIAGAYLTRNGQVIAQYNSINQGVIDFSGLNWQIPAGQTQELMLAIDVAGGLSAGNTTGFSLASASDVSAWDMNNTAITPTGAFPLMGNTFTVTSVTNPSLATLAITSSSVGTQVTAGTQGNIVGAWNFNVGNSKSWLKSINFRVIGSANKGDIRNVKLVVNGTQVGQTLASVGQDGNAFFDASANPGVLNTGNNNVQLMADVVGSPSFNFQFEILNGYDVYVVDSQYNVPVATNSNQGTAISIQQGQITVTQDLGTPTGNIAKGQSQIPLAKFDIYAAGEAVRVKFLTFQLTYTGATSTIKNLSLVDDAGGQLGTTINTPPTGNTCDVNGTPTASGFSGLVFTDCFGTASSPVNYVIPANTTRVLTLKGDVQSNAGFTTVTASLTGNTSNLQGVTSSQTNSSGGATGSALSLANSSLTVSANNALGNQNVSAGSTNVKIGSYSFTAASAEGVNVNTVSVKVAAATTTSFSNLKLKIGSTQFGTTQGTVTGGTTYVFSGAPFNVPAGSTVNVDVYADTLSGATAGTIATATQVPASGVSATGQISFTAITVPASTVNGQNLTFAGQSTITVTADSSQPAAAQLVMGSTGNTLAVYRFTETSNVENVKVTDLVVTAVQTSTAKAGVSNLQLWNGSTLLGTAGSASSTANGQAYSFHLATPLIVPQANSVSVTLKGDVASFASGGATDNSTSSFQILATSTDVTALGATSNKSTNVSSVSGAAGNTMTILRTTLTASVAPLGTTSGRAKSATDDLGTVTLSANSAGPAELTKMVVTFSGSAATTSLLTTSNVLLIDANGNNVAVADGATSTVSGSAVTFTFSTPFQISAGTSYTFKVRVNSAAVAAVASVSQSLSATIQASGDITYDDALDAAKTTGVTLPAAVVPLNINSVTYAQGS